MPASLSSEQKLERFLTYLATERDVAASTQNQAFNAILFFYKDVLGQPLKDVDALRATRPAHLRHAPTLSETRALLLAVRDRAGYPTSLMQIQTPAKYPLTDRLSRQPVSRVEALRQLQIMMP